MPSQTLSVAETAGALDVTMHSVRRWQNGIAPTFHQGQTRRRVKQSALHGVIRRLAMEKSNFSITRKDEKLLELVSKTAHKTLALWAIDCAERVMPYFEEKYPQDHRPRQAIETLKTWIETGVFKMAVIRKASLDSHAAAREVGEDSPARSAARAAGQ